MQFLLWRKGSHKNIVDAFKCSDENSPNSSCHFPKHKSVFLQVLHDSSVSWNITRLYFLRSNILYFAQKGRIKGPIFYTFWCSDQNSPSSCYFWNKKSVFLQILHSLVSWAITLSYFFYQKLYILSAKVAYQSTNFVKCHLSRQKSEILYCGGLLL